MLSEVRSRKPPPLGHELRKVTEAVFGRTSKALAELIAALPEGSSIRRPVDLRKTLDVDTSLAWRTFRIAHADDPLEISEYFLSAGQVNTLIDAALRKRVPEPVIAEVRAATSTCNDLLRKHAGSRESLRMMVGSLRENNTNLIDEKCRRSLFRQNSLVWGQEIDVNLACVILQPGSAQDTTHAVIRGLVDFHMLRPGKGPVLTMETNQITDDPAPFLGERIHVPIVAHDEVLREFCSPDLAINVSSRDADDPRAHIKLSGIGRQSAVNYYQLFTHAVACDGLSYAHRLLFLRPAAVMHADILMPAIDHPRKVTAHVYGDMEHMGTLPDVFDPDDIMPIEVSPTYLGAMTDMQPAIGVSRYPEMVRRVLEHLGWYGRTFDVYRCRLTYPIMNTTFRIEVRGDSR